MADIPAEAITAAAIACAESWQTKIDDEIRRREQRLVVASTITGRELQSSYELSLNEASTLIDTLENCGSRDNLMALLAAKPVRPAAEIREDDGNG